MRYGVQLMPPLKKKTGAIDAQEVFMKTECMIRHGFVAFVP